MDSDPKNLAKDFEQMEKALDDFELEGFEY